MDRTTIDRGNSTEVQGRGLVELFDPPLCCPTGLCGPTLDQTLLDVNELVLALKAEGVEVERYQMASHPHVFVKHPDVMRLVRERGMEAFPITVIDGQIIKVGTYPTRDEIDHNLLEANEAKGSK
jgi:hypothetical protein